jgi:hypothetical protein
LVALGLVSAAVPLFLINITGIIGSSESKHLVNLSLLLVVYGKHFLGRVDVFWLGSTWMAQATRSSRQAHDAEAIVHILLYLLRFNHDVINLQKDNV